MFKNILVAIDPGLLNRSTAMLNSIQSIIQQGDARITLLSVVAELPGFVAAQLPDNLHENAVNDAQKALNGLIETYKLPAGTTATVVTGHPFQTIRKVADEGKFDLVVVGSHQPGAADILLGSVAGQVVRHAHCSVLVVR